MNRSAQSVEARVFSLFRREPPRGWVHRSAFWLYLFYLALDISGLLPGEAGLIFRALSRLILFPLTILCVVLLYRWVTGRLLWKVRNRLVVTYLLMGLAPLVLFATLAVLIGYILSGQFATFAATSGFHTELVNLSAEDRDFALHVAQTLAADPKAEIVELPDFYEDIQANGHGRLQIAAFADGRKLQLAIPGQEAEEIETLPTWGRSGFQGIVVDGSKIHLRAIESETVAGHTATLVASLPVEKTALDRVAADLGAIHVMQGEFAAYGAAPQSRTSRGSERETYSAIGGVLPQAKNVFDIPIGQFALLPAVEWTTGKPPLSPVILLVTSRPSLLYRRLSATSLQTSNVVEEILIAIALFFCVLELIAFVMAVRLNQTITESIHSLYRATTEIDSGNLRHRISVQRRDQLGALSESFNRMSASLDRLLIEQREKHRLENELTIAQEVQANLFPRTDLSLHRLELHGVCRPARTVSGDYFDFLVMGESEVFVALGDISGKGISAALLMATLHSAVRAYQFASET
ncbi:MAG TPA: HAMP domain-containing protein, partial [Acidobacteriaceae bacterium]|nr:HAMP domain-containing protein [Acidobacteriaceae bacterium]